MRKRNFTYILSNKENDSVNELIEKYEKGSISTMLTKTEKQYSYMKNLLILFDNDYQKTFTIYTNTSASFQL